MPQIFEQLANQSAHPVFIMQHTPGGVSVGDTIQDTLAHMNNPTLYSYIRNYSWDYLVLQDNQGRFVYNYGTFPASSKVIEGHMMIRDSLLYYSPCAKMLWFAGWGPKNGYLPYASTGIDLIDRIYSNYLFLLDTAGQIIAPIGPAWKNIVLNHPALNLWDVDDVHPGPTGSLLTACVIYSTVFKSNASESAYVYPGVSAGDDSLLRQTAFQIVTDSLYATHLIEITPPVTCSSGACYVQGFTQVNWYQNGVLVSTDSVFSPDSSSYFTAIVVDSMGCTFNTFVYPPLNVVTTDDLQDDFLSPSVYPNPFSGYLIFRKKGDLVIYNAIGEKVLTAHLNNDVTLLDVSALPCGYYFYTFNSSDRSIVKTGKVCKY